MSTTTLTMTDIAALAGVKRPVVSMWRNRPTSGGELVPFPLAVERVSGIDRYALEDVLDYLASTGRGLNHQATLDAPGIAAPEATSVDDLVVLLTLRHRAGDDLGGQDLDALAAEVDPEDLFMRREVATLGDADAAWIDQLYAASFGGSDALDRLLATRAARTERRFQLTADGVKLVSGVVEALLVDIGEGAVVVDDSGGAVGVLQVVGAAGAGVRFADEAPDEARGARRLAALRGLDVADASADSIRLDVLIGVDESDALVRIDEMCLRLSAGEVGLLLGPAAALTDRIASAEADAFRAQNIRDGHLLAAVRLPRRMIDGAPRQAMACWLVTGAPDPARPIASADLGDSLLTEIDTTDLANDLVAARTAPRAHHFRYLVGRSLASVVAGRTVVDRGVVAVSRAEQTDAAGRLQALVGELAAPQPRLWVVEAPVTTPGGVVTIATLRARGDLQLKRGSRLDSSWADPDGTVEVADVDGWQGLRFDPYDVQERAPQALRTEPGDVVVTTNPPSARVEARGGRLVPTPARVIRLGDLSPVGPHTLAHQINQQPASARDLLAWRVSLPGDPAVEQRLEALDHARADLRRRTETLDEVARLVADGAAGLTVQFDPTTPSTERND